ncbi:MAG: START domain-containing protein [Pseudomonadota bacterium]
MLRGLIVTVLSLVSLSVQALGLPYEWELAEEGAQRDEVTRYISDVPDQSIQAFRGVIEVPHTVPAVIAALTDSDHFDRWVYQFKSLERHPTGKNNSLYMTFKAMWPASDRDVVVISSANLNLPSGVVEIVNLDHPDYPERDGHVRIEDLDNRWILTPLEKGWTRIDFQTFVDAGGWIPGWLANLVSKNAPVRTLEDLKTQLERGDYRYPKLEDLPSLPKVNWFDNPAIPD